MGCTPGFHFTRRQLDGMPDPAEAHARRGAPWTFDADAFVSAIRHIRAAGGRSKYVQWRAVHAAM